MVLVATRSARDRWVTNQGEIDWAAGGGYASGVGCGSSATAAALPACRVDAAVAIVTSCWRDVARSRPFTRKAQMRTGCGRKDEPMQILYKPHGNTALAQAHCGVRDGPEAGGADVFNNLGSYTQLPPWLSRAGLASRPAELSRRGPVDEGAYKPGTDY